MKRWGVQIRGLESGRVTEMPFLRFRRRSKAEEWVRRLNRDPDRAATVFALESTELTRFELVRLNGRSRG